MNINEKKLDAGLYKITRVMWFFLTVSALNILYTVHRMTLEPETALGVYHMIPEMIEHVLAGCVVVTALGAVFEYLSKRS